MRKIIREKKNLPSLGIIPLIKNKKIFEKTNIFVVVCYYYFFMMVSIKNVDAIFTHQQNQKKREKKNICTN